MKERNFALPEDDRFKTMSDILYTYLYAISKHNPTKRNGSYIQQYNYIYLDKGPNGEPKYSHADTMRKLGISKATYYRKFDKLIDLHLIERTTYNGRPIIKLPFIDSERILNVRTCQFLSTAYSKLAFPPEDIIKVLSLLKIYFYSEDKTFTTRVLKANLGYSLTNKDKDSYVRYMLDILRGLDLIDFTGKEVKKGAAISIIYTLTKVDDSFNNRLQWYEAEQECIDFDTELTEQELKKILPIK